MDPGYSAAAARRILAGHLSNLYAEVIDVEAACRNLDGLSIYAGEQGDAELEQMAAALREGIEAGEAPTLVLTELGVMVAPDPDNAPAWTGADTARVVEEATAKAQNPEPETRDPATSAELDPATSAELEPGDPEQPATSAELEPETSAELEPGDPEQPAADAPPVEAAATPDPATSAEPPAS